MSRIRLTIDRLVLKGLEAGAQKPLVDTLQSELQRVLSNRAVRTEWARSHRTPVLKLGTMPLESGTAGARKFGAQIARGIGRRLKP
jgi:hypothetical protein